MWDLLICNSPDHPSRIGPSHLGWWDLSPALDFLSDPLGKAPMRHSERVDDVIWPGIMFCTDPPLLFLRICGIRFSNIPSKSVFLSAVLVRSGVVEGFVQVCLVYLFEGCSIPVRSELSALVNLLLRKMGIGIVDHKWTPKGVWWAQEVLESLCPIKCLQH